MAKVKTDYKFKVFSGMLSNAENFGGDDYIILGGNSSLSETKKIFHSKKKYFADFVRRFFLFLPGSLLLYFISFSTTILFSDSFSHHNFSFPNSFSWNLTFDLFVLLFLFVFLILGSLMTWIGLGRWRNKNHSIIPVSIIVIGTIIGIGFGVPRNTRNVVVGILEFFNIAIFFFPLVLIVPVLLKKWIDKKDNRISAEF